MKHTHHFLSGLPRSGSTVLAAILSQHPEVYVSASSPLVGVIHGAKKMWDESEHVKAWKEEGQQVRVYRAMFDAFYEKQNKPVVIDKNRAWAIPEKQELLKEILGTPPRILATVRPFPEILASFLVLIRKNPSRVSFIDQELANDGLDATDENRCALLMSENGHVFQAWAVLKDAFREHRENLHLVSYDDLVSRPEEVLRGVEKFLNLPTFGYDFENVHNKVEENDIEAYNLPGMHAIRALVKKTSQDARQVLGDALYEKYQGGEFWSELPNSAPARA